MSNKSNRGSLSGNILLFVGISFLMFGAAEVVVRILYKDTTVMFPRYHTDAAYGEYTLRTIRPNSNFVHTSTDGQWEFTTNKQGFRSYEDYEYPKPDGVIRIVVLGDSHTQGYEVHQDLTYSAIIEKYLAVRGIESQVINTGVSGFSNAEALILLENELYKYEPDFVVLGFFANDFQDNIKSGLFELDSDGKLVSTGKMQHTPGVRIQNFIYSIPGISWLSENSYFYSLLFNNAWSYAKKLLAKKRIEEVMEVAVATKQDFSDYESGLAAALLNRIFESSRKMGARFILADIPALGKNGLEVPSINENFYALIEDKYDYFQSSEQLLQMKGLKVIHRPNGHRHITEISHTQIGTEIGKYIFATTRAPGS